MYNSPLKIRTGLLALMLFCSTAIFAIGPQNVVMHPLQETETFSDKGNHKEAGEKTQLEWLVTTDLKGCGADSQQCQLIKEMLATETAKQRYQDSLLVYYGYDLKNAKSAFDFQTFTTRFIFWMVIVIVTLGVFFAVINFIQSISLLKKKTGKDVATEFKAGLDGVEIKTSLVGFLILTVSLLFFYLYLKEVYPIKLVETGKDTVKTEAKAKHKDKDKDNDEE